MCHSSFRDEMTRGKPPCSLSELSVIISEHRYQCGRQHRKCQGMTLETTALPQPETLIAVTTVQQEGLTLWSIIIRLFFSFTKWSCSLWACWTMWLACFFSAEIFSWETEVMVERHTWDNQGFASLSRARKKGALEPEWHRPHFSWQWTTMTT